MRHFLSSFRTAHLWVPGYLEWRRRSKVSSPPSRIWVTFADHFEPFWHDADEQTALRRVQIWRRHWPEIASRHSDAAGRPPRYTFFYPEEQYHPRVLDLLAEMTEARIADVEVHIHHDGEGERNFLDRMNRFKETLFHRHGLLRKHDGRIVFGFIHGNWALDNSLPNGRWCGLNNELILLRDLDCFADFTLPSAPSPAQARMVNTIYWAKDDPRAPKSHNTGVPVAHEGTVAEDLMIIPGPLGIDWRPGGGRWLPRLETGELAAHAVPSSNRARLWLQLAPRIADDAFVKLFAHGAQEKNANALLAGGLDLTIRSLQSACTEAKCELYFVSAWEMRLAIEAVRNRGDWSRVLSRRPLASVPAGTGTLSR